MNVLILGGAGFVGANLARRLLKEESFQVTIFDSLDNRLKSTTENLKEIESEITFIKGDIRDQEALEKVIPQVDIIFHAAAQTSHPLSMKDPLFDTEVNCLATIKILEAVRKLNPEAKVIYISTTTVIGKAIRDIIDEEHIERPTEIYSANKGVSEKYYQIYNKVHGIKTMVLRFPNLFGPYGKPFPEFSFINYFVSKVWNEEQIEIYGTGDSVRNVMYIDDAADLLLESIRSEKMIGEILFATTPFHYSVKEIAEKITKEFGRGSLKLIPWPEERKVIEVGAQRFSSSRLSRLTNWRPKHDLSSGLKSLKSFLEKSETQDSRMAL